MSRIAYPIAALAALAAPAAAAEVQIPSQGPVVELTVTETVYSAPDVAQVGAGVQTRSATAQEAVKLNASAMQKVIDKLRALGIASKDIQTSNFSLNAQYDYREGQGQRFIGYEATNQVLVKLRNLGRTGEVLDALVAAGANNVHGPNFMLEASEKAQTEARGSAFKRGRTMAEDYARMAGFTGVRLLEISETYQNFGRPMAANGAVRASKENADSATPVEPGEVGTAAVVTVKYEMTR